MKYLYKIIIICACAHDINYVFKDFIVNYIEQLKNKKSNVENLHKDISKNDR